MKICHITSTRQDAIPRLLRESNSAVRAEMTPFIVSVGESCEKNGVTYIGVSPAKSRLHRMIFTSKKLYKEALKIDADVYQIHDPELLRFAMKLVKRGKRVIFDSHEFYGLQIESKAYLPVRLRKIIAKLYMKYETFICKRIDAVIAVCTVNGKDYFKDRTKKTIFLENLPDNDFLSKDDILDNNEDWIVYVGALNHMRGITHLVKTADKVNAKLILCGPFNSDEYYSELKALKEFESVEYKGVVSKEEVIKTIKNSKIGISTLLHKGQYSQIDTLPTKVYEYMALGKPVIISDTTFAKKLNDKYKFGICVNPENINEMAEKINYILNNPEEAKKMGENGMWLVENICNWSIEEKKLIDLYRELT
ncbi:glycosyltransferase [Metasolibacillus sp.]|uniref:glycosyltransferase n=1 Tax=Metasolibacillus sp. TaxID=2703680 RepID=UPI0025FC8FF9|nr:glycosyltransferase [Metasolibacillus sp.]MCT6923380.1 glycosyltransferase [Metasolibacillus sp.]MCT6939897.1 glycosyltransferase [Metasolibacillus sp.]